MSAQARPDRFVPDMVAWLNARFAPQGVRIAGDTPLFAGGLINSIRVLEIIAWVERAVGRPIPDRQISMENFQTVERMAEVFVEEAERVVR